MMELLNQFDRIQETMVTRLTVKGNMVVLGWFTLLDTPSLAKDDFGYPIGFKNIFKYC